MGVFSSCFRSTISCLGGNKEGRFRRKRSESIMRLQEDGKVIIEKFPTFGETFESVPSNLDAPTVFEGNVDTNDRRRLTASQSFESLQSLSPKFLTLTKDFTRLTASSSSSLMNSPPILPQRASAWLPAGSEEFQTSHDFEEKLSVLPPRPSSRFQSNLISENFLASRIPPSMETSSISAVSTGFNPRQPQLEMLQRRNPALFEETMESISNSMLAKPLTCSEPTD